MNNTLFVCIFEFINNYYYFDCFNEELKDDPKNLANHTMPKLSDKLLKYMGITEEDLNRPDYPMYVFSKIAYILLLFVIENDFVNVTNKSIDSFLKHLKTIDESIIKCRFKKYIKNSELDTYLNEKIRTYLNDNYLALY